jgi:hypothetical protein
MHYSSLVSSCLTFGRNILSTAPNDAKLSRDLLRLSVPRIAPGQPRPFHGYPLPFSLPLIILLALWSVSCLSQPLVIRHITVIDATGRAPEPGMSVVIDADHIVAVGPWKKIHAPKDALTLDGQGKFLIPGLWDMHVHGASDTRARWSHLLFLANGVVGVREMSGPPDAHAWRAMQASAPDPSPTIYLGSPIVDGQNPVWPDSIVVANAAQGREVVDQQQQRGADFIKVYGNLSRDAYFAIADEANKRGIPFEGHVPESADRRRSIRRWPEKHRASDPGGCRLFKRRGG